MKCKGGGKIAQKRRVSWTSREVLPGRTCAFCGQIVEVNSSGRALSHERPIDKAACINVMHNEVDCQTANVEPCEACAANNKEQA